MRRADSGAFICYLAQSEGSSHQGYLWGLTIAYAVYFQVLIPSQARFRIPLHARKNVHLLSILSSTREQDDAAYKKDDVNSSVGHRGYYVDGLTPPTKNIVRRRFLKARPDQGKFDPAEVRIR